VYRPVVWIEPPGNSYKIGGLERIIPSDAGVAPGGCGCKVGLRGGFYTTLYGGLEAMLY